VPELPLTSQGKVNRRALASMEPLLESSTAMESPRTPMQELMASVWADVLGCDRVGLHEQFFAIGGQSLLAMQVVARLRALNPGLTITPRDLFDHPTVAALAERVAARGSSTDAALPPIRPLGRGGRSWDDALRDAERPA
jgi:aryl carrier-like protein